MLGSVLCDDTGVWGMMLFFIHCRRDGMSSVVGWSVGQRSFLTADGDRWGKPLEQGSRQFPKRKFRQILASSLRIFDHSSSEKSLSGELRRPDSILVEGAGDCLGLLFGNGVVDGGMV